MSGAKEIIEKRLDADGKVIVATEIVESVIRRWVRSRHTEQLAALRLRRMFRCAVSFDEDSGQWTLERGTNMKAGDRIRVQIYCMGKPTGQTRDYFVEEFRFCLGVFLSAAAEEAGHFTPLCELYKPAGGAETRYIPNYGEYWTKMVPAWEVIE